MNAAHLAHTKQKRLRLVNISKRYPNKTVPDGLSCDIEEGSLYALLGENGAGKSTLAAIMCGEKKADEGKILYEGLHTVAAVHQRPLLADELCVRDNIILGNEPKHGAFIDFNRAELSIKQLTSKWHFPIDLHAKAASLSAAERLYTALTAALYKNTDVLILDEPGAVLNEDEKKRLYPALKSYARTGKAVILITHNISDALAYTDCLIPIVNGKVPALIKCSDTNFCKNQVRTLLFGGVNNRCPAQPEQPIRRQNAYSRKNALLTANNLCFKSANGIFLQNIDFCVYPQSITCIYGKRENGLEILENLTTGIKSSGYVHGGSITLASTDKSMSTAHKQNAVPTVKQLRDFGTGIVPFNRALRASFPNLTVEQMLCVYLKHPEKKEAEQYAQKLIRQAGISIGIKEKVSALSGGMLQRLIIERETDTFKMLLILSEPAQGLDTPAVCALEHQLRFYAGKGTGILLFMSADSPEIFNPDVCYFLNEGHLYEA